MSKSIFEVLTEEVGHRTLHKVAVDNGMKTLCFDGIQGLLNAVTGMEEIRWVTGDLLEI